MNRRDAVTVTNFDCTYKNCCNLGKESGRVGVQWRLLHKEEELVLMPYLPANKASLCARLWNQGPYQGFNKELHLVLNPDHKLARC